MSKYKYAGGCYCRSITFEMKITNEVNFYNPRACDCNFCLKHGASYISDNEGKLVIYVRDESIFNRYRQGNKIADFLICKVCGVLIGVCYENNHKLYAAINSKAIDNIDFKTEKIVSPKMLSENEKIERWADAWFSEVSIEQTNPR